MGIATKSQELIKCTENSPGTTSQIMLVSYSSKKKAGNLGWLSGVGIIIMCGICCSLPLLGGGLAIGGTALLAFFNVSWVWLGFGLISIIVTLLLTRRYWSRPAHSGSSSSGRLAKSCISNGGKCPADRSCGCGK